MADIRYVRKEDKNFWFKLDKHLSDAEFEKKIRDKMGYLILENEVPVGLLRYNLFWDSVPFCTMLFVDMEYQHKGYGKKLVYKWEEDMKMQGQKKVMTSTAAEEDAQHFYYKLGYHSIGGLTLPEDKYELVLCKKI